MRERMISEIPRNIANPYLLAHLGIKVAKLRNWNLLRHQLL